MKSLVSYPDRGPWGDSRWRGNTSGHLIRDLILHFRPRLFVDVCEGSGTSRQVCEELGVEYVGLDLMTGTDFTRDYVLSRLSRPADMVFSHPPYHDMIPYSGHVWGDRPVEGDLSHCRDVEEFLEKAQIMLLNQREATRTGGIYATLIGDMRKRGRFYSFQSDFIQMMPKSELLAVVIKAQHNASSFRKSYSGSFIPIVHEYLLIWKKSSRSLFLASLDKVEELRARARVTWKTTLRMILMRLGGQASLEEIYREVEREAPDYVRSRPNWKAKVRQRLQAHFRPVSRGVWALAA